MKRNVSILLAVVVLSVLVIYLVMNRGEGTVAKELRDFAFADTAAVDKIFLADKTGKQVTLVRNDDNTWTLNEEFKARPDAINNLLNVVKHVSVREPVGLKARESVIKHLATGSVKVELYVDDEIKRLFYVGGETQDMLGTYMLLADPETGENSSEPFIMEMKGMNGYLTPYFSPDYKEWRDKTAFQYYVPDIRTVKVEHKGEPENSFIITQSPNMEYGLQTITGQPLPFDTAAVRQYLSYFIRLGFVEFANDYARKDSVLATQPEHVIAVQDATGKKNTVRLYLKPGGGVLERDTLNPEAPRYDVDNMYASVNDGRDFVIVQYFVFGKMLQTPEYFQRRR